MTRPTPPEIRTQFQTLLAGLSTDLPGQSVASLEVFLHQNRSYEIADTVRSEIDRYLALAKGRYHEARELARQGQFERAEQILTDLAEHLPNTAGGDAAQEYLAYDFHLGRAHWLLVRQRYDESAAVARSLLERDLTRTQEEQVEIILDNVGHVSTALGQAERASAQAACRHLMIMMEQQYIEEGSYPDHLSLSDVKAWDPHGSRSVLRALSALEGYRASRDSYSFVAISSGGRHRIRVVDGELQD